MTLAGSNRNNKYGWYIAIVSALIGCMLSAGFPQFSMAVSHLSEQMGAAQETLLLGDTIKTVAVVMAMWVSGFCYKKLGPHKTVIMGMLLTIIPQSVFPYNNSVAVFFILKFIQGFTAIIFPIFLLLIMDWVEDLQTGFATAVFNGIFYGGGGIGSTFAGFVINKWGWIASFHAIGISLAVLMVIWLITVKERKHSPAEKAVEQGEQDGETSAGISIWQLLKNPKVYCLILCFVPTTFAVQAISVDLPLYGSFLGYSELQNGSLGTAVTIGMVVSCLISGKCSDYFAAKSRNKAAARVGVIMVGCAIIVASIAVLLLSKEGNFSVLYGAVLFFSFGASWGLGVFYSILPDVFDTETLQIATGFIGGFGDMMMPIAPFIVGVLFGIKGLWVAGWGVCAVMAALGLAAGFILVGLLKKQQSANNGINQQG